MDIEVLIETAAEPDPWSALVGIGPLALALVTVLLAGFTGKLAKEASADQRAQWRPLLLPVGEWEERSRGRITYPRGIKYRGNTLLIRIRNSGRGPALHVRARLDRGEHAPLPPANWSLGALEVENIKWLQFDNAVIGDKERAQLLIDYQDMAGRHHVTASIIKREANGLFLDAVKVLEDHSVNGLDYSVYPQEFLQNVVKKHKAWRHLLGPLLVCALCGVGIIFILLFTHES